MTRTGSLLSDPAAGILGAPSTAGDDAGEMAEWLKATVC